MTHSIPRPPRTPAADGWLTASEAIARLGVKEQTLYAYVSRGLVRRERVTGTRASRYSRADVERLAAKGRRIADGPGPEIVIDSAITLLEPAGHLYYRGWDVTRAAVEASYEDVAAWLWNVEPEDHWTASAEALAVARGVQAALPAHASLGDRVRVVAAAVGSCDPLRADRRPPSVAARARGLIATLVDALPSIGADGGSSVAARLWSRVSPMTPTPARVKALNAAMVLLADHELAASTLAVRVAASTWADPYLLVGAGLAAAGGPLHAGASEKVRALVREVAGGSSAEAVIGMLLQDGQPIPGFGHSVYQGVDPRATVLLEAVHKGRPPTALWRAANQVLEVVARHDGPHPNVDFALGVLAEANDMVAGAGEAIFVIARCAGWIAHGLEEYPHRLRYRIRAAYTGAPPTTV